MKILVFCLPGIGDALMATPMIRLMKKKIPAAKIDIACMFDGVSYVFKNNPHIHKIHRLSLYYENKLIGLKQLLSLRNNKYDISILAFPSYRREYHIVQSLVAAANRISHRFKKGYLSEFNFLDTHSIEVDEKVHNVINNLNILKYFSIDWQKEIDENNLSYDFTINQDDDNFGIKYIHNLKWTKQDIVGFHPGSISSKAGILKRWPIENFAGLGKLLIKKNKKILIFIGPEEIGLGKALIRLIDDVSGCHLLENMKFHQTIGILNNIGKLITNDNGFAHLSNGLRISSIVLFGPTNPVWCAPYNNKFSVNIRKSKFEPWFRNDMKVTQPPAGIKSGMEQIKIHHVAEYLQ